MVKCLIVIAVGSALGLFAGVLAPVVFIAACVWDDRTEWSSLLDPKAAPYIAVLGGLGLINGGVGAWDGWRSGLCRQWPVALAPAALFLFPIYEFAQYPTDSKTWGIALLAVCIVAPFIWVAGRISQEVGVRGRPQTASTGIADPAST